MDSIVLRPLAEVDFTDFTRAFNLAYSDYFVPIIMTPSAFRALMKRDDLDMEASVVALQDGVIVGTGLLGIREARGWIGGMGVIPTQRRHGIGGQMMDYLLEQARARELRTVQLEVIEANTGAHALYRQLGFQDRRYLLMLEREPGPPDEFRSRFEVQERPASTLLQHYAAFHDRAPNCWQRGLRSLDALTPHVESWAALQNLEIAGYALGWAGPGGIRLLDFATRPAPDRVSAAQAMLIYLHQQYPDAPGSSYNIAEDDPALPAYEAVGYRTTFRQIEMELALAP